MTQKNYTPKPAFTTVTIKCEPLVKKYLENNFGSPVVIPEKHVLNKLIASQMVKNNTRTNDVKEYPSEIIYCISECNFRYDGFFISDQNTRNFNTSVDNFIKSLYRSNLDSLLISQAAQLNWKNKFFELMDVYKTTNIESKELSTMIKKYKAELEEHEISIQKAIDTVMRETLHLTYEDLNFETIKKDYYRYRKMKKNTRTSIN